MKRNGTLNHLIGILRLDELGNPKLLEVNPNPGWCWDGHLAKMANFAGYNYPEMLKMILDSAEERIKSSNITDNKVKMNLDI